MLKTAAFFVLSTMLLAAEVNGDGSTPLHAAVIQENVEEVKRLLQAKANVGATTRIDGLTPLLLASGTGNAPIVAALLKAGADVNSRTLTGSTALMFAAASGSVEVLKLLIDGGAEINAKDTARGQTALMFAAAENRADAIRLLSSRGANVALASNVVKLERPRVDEDGNPLPAARPAASGGRAGGGGGLGGSARGASATVMGGMTALTLAARQGALDAVKALLEAGAEINQPSDAEKTTPIVTAICNGHYDLAKYLLDRGADPNKENIDGLAALYAVIDTEWAQVGWAPNPITGQEKITHLELMKTLLDKGANPNTALKKTLWFRPTHHNQEWVDKKGATPFWRAAASSDVAAMKLLVAGGANPTTPSAEGVTPLMVAAGLGWGANASRNAPDSWLTAVKYCLEVGNDVNAKDQYNYTALHGAAYRGDNEVVEFLVKAGAKLDVRSRRGQTVSDMANGPMVNAHLPTPHPDTIALLQKLGAPGPEVPVAGAPRGQR